MIYTKLKIPVSVYAYLPHTKYICIPYPIWVVYITNWGLEMNITNKKMLGVLRVLLGIVEDYNIFKNKILIHISLILKKLIN